MKSLSNKSRSYFKKFTVIISGAFALLLFVIALITVNEIINNYTEYEKELINKIEGKANYIDNLILDLKKQVEILTDQINYQYVRSYHSDSSFHQDKLYFEQLDSVHYSMDNRPDSLKQQLGNLHGFGNVKEKLDTSKFERELQVHLTISPLLAAIHRQYSNIAWVYLLSIENNFINLFPYAPSANVTYDPIYNEYDIVTMGTPSNNRSRELYVTPAYLDAGGEGLMVSIGKPYYNKSEFIGVSGIDVTLNFISKYIKQTLSNDDEIFILNEKNQFIGHSNENILDSTAVTNLQSIDPELLHLINENNGSFKSNGRKYYTLHLQNVNWKLIFSTQNTSPLFLEINRFFILMVSLLFAIVFALSFVAYQFYISPARKLTRYIEEQSQNIINDTYSVTPIWQEWFKKVGDSFQKSRNTIELLDSQVNQKTRELQSAYNDLQTKTLQLEESNAYKDRIFSVLSHDLRSSLSSLTAILDLFQKDHLTQKEFLKHSKLLGDDTKKVRIMMENLLKWSINNLDAFEVTFQEISLRDEVEQTIDMLSSIARNKKITISTAFATINKPEVITDKGVVELVLRNLLMNAIKFSKANSTIIVRIDDHQVSGFIVQITDTGIGIPEHIQNKLFQAGQGIQTGTYKEKGTGLGLSLSKEFLNKIGGDIWFESKPYIGTTFSFVIPYTPSTAEKQSKTMKLVN